MEQPTRRRVLRAVAASTVAGLAGCAAGPGTDSATDEDGGDTGGEQTTGETTTGDGRIGGGVESVGLETLAAGLDAPVDVVPVPDSDRRYVVEQTGVVRVHGPDGLRETPLVDLRDTVEAGGEKGLLGASLHPRFPEDRRLFVRYSAAPRAGTPDDYSHTFVLAAIDVRADGVRADRSTERSVLEIPQPQANHNAGDLAFGPDGLLYVAVGDGGGAGDRGTGHVEDWYDGVSGGNGQDVTENLLGSVLRIDVDAGGRGGYGVPSDNPLVGDQGLDEHYAWGLRNPWRMSFDGDRLLVGDVGQGAREEVDLVERGGNYGWNVREGTTCYRADDCPAETPEGRPLIDPVLDYPHDGDGVAGISVIGGYVYRGSAVPDLQGTYVFGDYVADGRLFAADPTGDTWPSRVLSVRAGDRSKLGRIRSFGRGSDGELYVLGFGENGGAVHRVVA